MITRLSRIRSTSFLFPVPHTASVSIQLRYLHRRILSPPVPLPTPFVPDPQTFLTLIGRKLSQHASKIPSWEALFSLTSTQLRDIGIEPPRSRRYLLRWRERFRNGEFGICGDAKFVVDGTVRLSIVEVPKARSNAATSTKATATLSPGMQKIIANIPPGVTTSELPPEQLTPVKGLKIKGSHTVIGPHVQLVRGTGGKMAKIGVKEGLWEDRRGLKVDGGERRQAEVRAKRRSAERKESR
jgi:hypothetical protein